MIFHCFCRLEKACPEQKCHHFLGIYKFSSHVGFESTSRSCGFCTRMRFTLTHFSFETTTPIVGCQDAITSLNLKVGSLVHVALMSDSWTSIYQNYRSKNRTARYYSVSNSKIHICISYGLKI